MLAMCSATRLEQSHGHYAGVVPHITALAAATFQSTLNEDDVHLISLHFDEYLPGL